MGFVASSPSSESQVQRANREMGAWESSILDIHEKLYIACLLQLCRSLYWVAYDALSDLVFGQRLVPVIYMSTVHRKVGACTPRPGAAARGTTFANVFGGCL